jgi:hypothetical protein
MAELVELAARMKGSLAQIDKRLGAVEADLHGIRMTLQGLRTDKWPKTGAAWSELGAELDGLRSDMRVNFRRMVRLVIGMWITVVFAWISIIVTIFLQVE